MYTLEELNTKKVADLKVIAKELNLKKFEKLKKDDLAYAILDHQAENAKSQTSTVKEQRARTNKPVNQGPKKPENTKQYTERRNKPQHKTNDDNTGREKKTPQHQNQGNEQKNEQKKPVHIVVLIC